MAPYALRFLPIAAALVPSALAGVHEALDGVPAGWEAVEDVLQSVKLMNADAAAPTDTDAKPSVFTIALQRQNLDSIESKLLEVSSPGSAKYGQFLEQDEVDSLFSPAGDAASSVTSWLEQNGITDYNVDGAFVDFAADVPKANSLLAASYKHYRNKDGVTKLRTLSYSIPDDVQKHVALVEPGVYFGNLQAHHPVPGNKEERQDQNLLLPADFKKLYHINDYKPDPASGSKVAFGSFLEQSSLYSDLFDFEEITGIPAQNITKINLNGAVDDQSYSSSGIGESNLDAQTIMGIAHPLPQIEYLTGGRPPFIPKINTPTDEDNFNEPYLPYFRYLLTRSKEDLPQVISNSYAEPEDTVPEYYARLTCAEIGLLALRGTTTLFASGDAGVGALCLAPDNSTVRFNANFPPSCPFVTSVGGTVNSAPEAAWEGSGGGFSRYFSRPLFQQHAVSSYIKEHVSSETYDYYGQYNNWEGRAVPDVAAHSVQFGIVYRGELSRSGGTSASTPLWAGVVALLNDARLRAGKPQLGWLNPLIYAFGDKVLTDITEGYSTGCNGVNFQNGEKEPEGAGIVPGARWNATDSWDPVTGLGTPHFEKLKELVLAL